MALTPEGAEMVQGFYRTAIALNVSEQIEWGGVHECDIVDHCLALAGVPADDKNAHKMGHIFIAVGIAIGAQFEVR